MSEVDVAQWIVLGVMAYIFIAGIFHSYIEDKDDSPLFLAFIWPLGIPLYVDFLLDSRKNKIKRLEQKLREKESELGETAERLFGYKKGFNQKCAIINRIREDWDIPEEYFRVKEKQ